MKKLIILLAIVCSLEGLGQVNTYYFSDWSAESQWNYNPALQSKEKLFIYVPVISGIHVSTGHTGFAYKDGIQNKSVDFSSLINGLDQKNHLLNEINTTLFAVGVKFGKVQLRTGVSTHLESRFSYTKDLLELAWKGNGHPDVIGRRLSMDGTGFSSMLYSTFFLGGSVSLLDDQLNLGINGKFFNGLAAVYTENSTFGLRTSADDYTVTVDGSFDLRTSGLNTLGDSLEYNRFLPFSAEGNRGFGVDLGFTYSPVEKFTLEASATNLGSINWKQDTEGYKLNNQDIAYSGFDLDQFLSAPDSAESIIEQFADSITDLFIPEENSENFSTKMNRNIFLAGTINFSKKSKATVFFNSRNSFGETFNSLGGIYSKNFGRTLQLRGGLQIFNMKDMLIPVGFMINVGPVQLGLHTDNVASVIQRKKAKYVSGMFSIGLRFGKDERVKITD
ncbi:MAG: DUF5723 family protein [Flavobacteriales bacterium]